MKKMRKLIPAFAMLMVAAIMMSTASFAWFSMNTTATAGGMQVQAQASAGILISNGDGTWASSATAENASAKLMPVSTADGSTWYATTSTNAAEAQANNASNEYKTVSGTSYYLANSFYIKASTNEPITAQKLVVSAVTIDNPTAKEMNKAMRVLIKCGTTYYIYALDGTSYKVVSALTPTIAFENTITPKTAAANDDLGVASIPGVATSSSGAVKVDVYIYFEGEDARCMTNNILDGVDTLGVDITFGLQ